MKVYPYLHLPARHKETGSPTAITKDCARVIAVFKSLMLDRKPRSSLSAAAASVGHVCLVRTVLITITRNCFPVILEKKNQIVSYIFSCVSTT